MESKLVEELIKGVGVIIDDEIEDKNSLAYALSESLSAAGLPLVKSKEIPSEEYLNSLGNVSFIILDWFFDVEDMPEGVEVGEELKLEQKETAIHFLEKLLNQCFVPVFLITGQTLDDVESVLSEGLAKNAFPDRILLRSKNQITDYQSLITSVAEWLERYPSALVLKIWEKSAVLAKTRMFLELFSASPQWVSVILDTIRADTNNNPRAVNHEFSTLLNNNFVNRMQDGSFNDVITSCKPQTTKEEIRAVLQGERYICYVHDDLPDIIYTGDLFRETIDGVNRYYLNVRAQCDLSREDDPILYLVKGSMFDESNLIKSTPIKLKKSGEDMLLDIKGEGFPLKTLLTYGKVERDSLNDKIRELNSLITFSNGEVLEKKNQAIVFCVDGCTAIEFNLNEISVEKKSSIESKTRRVGRLMPPYITRIQQKISSYIVREGVMATPRALVTLQ